MRRVVRTGEGAVAMGVVAVAVLVGVAVVVEVAILVGVLVPPPALVGVVGVCPTPQAIFARKTTEMTIFSTRLGSTIG